MGIILKYVARIPFAPPSPPLFCTSDVLAAYTVSTL